MSIRKLDWSPLDLHADPIHADPDEVHAAQKRYQHISTTIDDAVAKLEKVVGSGSDDLVGQYVQGLKKDAGSIKDSLSKAAVRYHDVASEIGKYEPDLERGLSETAAARTDAEEAKGDLTKAKAMPDPEKDKDGETSSEEKEKGTAKDKATSGAEDKMTAAKDRLHNAVDALNVAGKRFGDAVNCNKYEDGLTDSTKDRIDLVLKKIGTIFGWIGLALGVLAILIPGVNLLVFAGVAAGVVSLVASSVLYAHGKGSLADVIIGAVGLGLAGLGGIASIASKGISNAAKIAAGFGGRGPRGIGGGNNIQMIPLGPGGRAVPNFSRPFGPNNPFRPVPKPLPGNAATNWKNMSEWFNNPATNWLLGKGGFVTPESGFWRSFVSQGKDVGKFWGGLLNGPGKFGKDFFFNFTGLQGARDLSAIVQAANLGKISPLWYVWGGTNAAFGLGGLIYTGGRLQEWIPDVNPPDVVAT
ncbi:hypothetical protein [Streptomyces pinistramenti]|uniref:hypothetical protein n=1 Tax=Streptomyces pinistramenti TaxID=2884812 RepID=UPI001D071B88|nr:hypothetical protein [Streptomyces pinistramenti]MCB5907526.1 hypothetical protein [Streptomyces pinistramenti]